VLPEHKVLEALIELKISLNNAIPKEFSP